MDLSAPYTRQRRYLLLALLMICIVFLSVISLWLLHTTLLTAAAHRYISFLHNDVPEYAHLSPVFSPSTTSSTAATAATAAAESETLPPSPYDPQKLAFMVETRTLPHLPAQFAHMASVIPPEWPLLFMGSPASIAHMRRSRSLTSLEATQRLRFILLPPTYSVQDRESISQMFTDPHLYATLLSPAEHLLVFQPDAIFCVQSEQSLNDYLAWDWVGAPWSANSVWGGNGGLSLRKVSRILDVLRKERRPHMDGALEDLWLAKRLHDLPGSNMPNASVSKHFSVESVWDERPLGYHIGYLGVHHEQIWDVPAQVEHVFEYCPEVSLIMKMEMKGDKPEGVA